MSWSEKEKKLIKLVHRHPVLYSKKVKGIHIASYRHRLDLQKEAWQEIGKIMNISATTCKSKFKCIWDQYSKIRKSLQDGNISKYSSKYCDPILNFLNSADICESEELRKEVNRVVETIILPENIVPESEVTNATIVTQDMVQIMLQEKLKQEHSKIEANDKENSKMKLLEEKLLNLIDLKSIAKSKYFLPVNVNDMNTSVHWPAKSPRHPVTQYLKNYRMHDKNDKANELHSTLFNIEVQNLTEDTLMTVSDDSDEEDVDDIIQFPDLKSSIETISPDLDGQLSSTVSKNMLENEGGNDSFPSTKSRPMQKNNEILLQEPAVDVEMSSGNTPDSSLVLKRNDSINVEDKGKTPDPTVLVTPLCIVASNLNMPIPSNDSKTINKVDSTLDTSKNANKRSEVPTSANVVGITDDIENIDSEAIKTVNSSSGQPCPKIVTRAPKTEQSSQFSKTNTTRENLKMPNHIGLGLDSKTFFDHMCLYVSNKFSKREQVEIRRAICDLVKYHELRAWSTKHTKQGKK